ncbi:hypothetical protein [Robertmurraya sp. Marseille-Q9965]
MWGAAFWSHAVWFILLGTTTIMELVVINHYRESERNFTSN